MYRWGILFLLSFAFAVQAAWQARVSEPTVLNSSGSIPSIAVARRTALVTWAEPVGDLNYEGRAALFDLSGRLLSKRPMEFLPSPVSRANGSTALQAASDGQGFVIARLDSGGAFSWWSSPRSGHRKTSVELPAPYRALAHLTLAGGPTGYMAAWTLDKLTETPYRRHDYQIAVMPMDRKGRPLESSARIVNPHESLSFSAQLASCRNRFILVWQSAQPSAVDYLRLSILDSQGVPGPIQTLNGAQSGNLEPSVCASGDSFTVVWRSIDTTTRLHLATLDLSGRILVTNKLAVNYFESPTIVPAPDGWLVIHTDHFFSPTNAAYGRLFDRELLPVGGPFVIDDQVGQYGTVTAESTMQGEVLLAIERRVALTNSHLITRRITFERVEE